MGKVKNRFSFMYLMGLMVVVYLVQLGFSGFTEMFVLTPLALKGEFWRFLSAIFLHGGGAHLASNLFALFLFGMIVESLVGSRRFLVSFFVCGVLANLYSVFFYPSSLGASGAIYGVIGVAAVLRPTMMVWAFGLIIPMFVAVFFWIVLDFLGVFVPDGVGHIAHLSGIFVGFLFGLYFRFFSSFRSDERLGKRRPMNIDEDLMQRWEKRYMR